MKRVILAVLFDYAARAAGALVLAAPVGAMVAASGIGNFPEGDRLLFERGGLLLVEVVRASWALLPPLAASSLVSGVVVFGALTLPQAILWSALGETAPESTNTFLGRACARVPAFLALTGLGFLAQILVLTLGLTAAGFLHGRATHDEMRTDLVALTALAVAALLALSCGVLRDVAGATLACGAANGRAALRAGLRVFLRSPLALAARWFVPASLGGALVLAVAFAVGRLDVGRSEGFRFLAVAVLHQLVVLGLTVCRAVWFRGAVRIVRPQLEAVSEARR